MTNEQLTLAVVAANGDATKIQEILAMARKIDMLEKQSGTLKVSTKGAISIYGLGRFPVTLYLSQYEAFKARIGEIDAFVEANREHLKVKAAKGESTGVN